MSENILKIGVLQRGGSVSTKFSCRRERSSPAIQFNSQNKVNDLTCGIRMLACVSLSQITRLTDRQTAFSWLDSIARNACNTVKTAPC